MLFLMNSKWAMTLLLNNKLISPSLIYFQHTLLLTNPYLTKIVCYLSNLSQHQRIKKKIAFIQLTSIMLLHRQQLMNPFLQRCLLNHPTHNFSIAILQESADLVPDSVTATSLISIYFIPMLVLTWNLQTFMKP